MLGNALELIQANVNIITIVGLIVTNILMIRQNRIAKKASDSQNMIDVIHLIQDEETRESRRHVFTQLKRKKISKWTPNDIKHAQKVCMSYDIAGRLIKEKYVIGDVIFDGWGYSVRKSHKILKGYLKVMSKTIQIIGVDLIGYMINV